MKFLCFFVIVLVIGFVVVFSFVVDFELMVFDWVGFEEFLIFQGYVDKYGDSLIYVFYGDDDEVYQKFVLGFKVDVVYFCL